MKTKFFFLAALTSVALVSCTSDEYLGENPAPASSHETQGAIAFGSGANALTRATQNTGPVADMLDHQFKVYGVKKSTSWSDVFQSYLVWDSQDKTTSNPDVTGTAGDQNGWEYVGAAGTHGGVEIASAQTIKYWDYTADKYHFVAGSPYANFTFAKNGTGNIATATVTGIAGHINPNTTGTGITTDPVYIADPVIVEQANYNTEVTFNFTRQQAYVRVGVFETIPGYSISDIKFYQYNESSAAWTTTKSSNITLASTTAKYFSGAVNATVTLTYDWSVPNYSYTYSGLTSQKNWYGGALTGVPATSSTDAVNNLYGTDDDINTTTGYFTVIPSATALAAAPILIKCDYTLTSEDAAAETIKISGATAAIPAAFTYWKPNTSYTYLFKISDNTNGTTGSGTPGTPNNPEGLFPITFDAVVIAETSGTEQGVITSVTTPSITTYQEGSVSATGIKYAASKPIYVTVQDDETGDLETLTESAGVGYIKVYSLGASAKTEADMQLTPPTSGITTLVISSEKTYGNVTLPGNKHAKFTPTSTGYYAIQYQTATSPAAYTYKVVKVE